ncbi:MAG: response regulator transcription factor [Eggerthellaceae bacterium]|nr:response regulator transcription factor [Eggerthellaceae bacterium]
MTDSERILVVDDEHAIADLVVSLLLREGMQARACYSGTQALEALEKEAFDLAILDIMMPGMDGFELCVRMRKMRDIPIIFLSAKDEEADQVVGFTLGADDYVTKPFRPRELVARVRARLRRAAAPAPVANDSLITVGPLEVDVAAHSASLHRQKMKLTPKEFAILTLLAQSAGRPVSAKDLFEGAWEEPFDDAASNTIMVHIRHLRKKLAAIDSSTQFIETAWGVGYRLKASHGSDGRTGENPPVEGGEGEPLEPYAVASAEVIAAAEPEPAPSKRGGKGAAKASGKSAAKGTGRLPLIGRRGGSRGA